MKSIKTVLIMACMTGAVLIAGCCNDECSSDCKCEHYVNVYIADNCFMRTEADAGWIKELFLMVDDVLVLNNLGSEPVEVDPPDGIFDVDKLTVPGHQRAMIKVIAQKDEPGSIILTCSDGSGGPNVRIGRNP